MTVKIKDIKINTRVRKDLGDLDALQSSIQRYGLLSPIIINQEYELLAGERRLKACQVLGWEEIEVKILDVQNALRKLEIEGEENFLRKDFTQLELEKIIQTKRKLTQRRFSQFLVGMFAHVKSWLRGVFQGNS